MQESTDWLLRYGATCLFMRIRGKLLLTAMIHDRIEINPAVMFGKPVIRGTRITVEQILRKLAAGCRPLEIIAEHPRLVEEDVYAAARFAADYLAQEEITFADGGNL